MNPSPDRRRIAVVAYNPAWEHMFAQEKELLLGAIGHFPCVVDIQHVGSTSVPGLAAKPVIDISVGITSFEDAVVCVGSVEALGYRYRGECGIPRRHYFSKDNPAVGDPAYRRTHHIHMCETASSDRRNTLIFRDALRSDTELARRYALLKRELARRFPDDTAAYCDAKTEFILNTVEQYRTGVHTSASFPV